MWMLALGAFVNRLGSFATPFLAIYLTRARMLPIERAGFIVSLVGFGAMGSGPVGGFLADRLGRRNALAIATLCGGSSMLALAFVRDVSLIAVVALLVGFCGDMYRPVVASITADVLPPEDRARGYGLLYWAVNLGVSISLLCAGAIADVSFTYLFVGDALTTFAFGALVCASVPDVPRSLPKSAKAHQTSIFAPYRDVRFLGVCLASLGIALMMLQGYVTLPLDMRAHGVTNVEYGAIFAINGIMVVVLQPFSSSIVSKHTPGRVLAACAVLTGFGFSICAISPGNISIYVLSLVIWTLGEIGGAPMMPALVSEMAPEQVRGSYQGAYQLSWGAASFLAPIVGTFMMHHFGARALWESCAALGLVCAGGYLTLVPSRNAGAPPARAT
ncbi:MAG: MDR family MFS transporter [Polyangiaceae bacterium]